MIANSQTAADLLTRRFITDFPFDAAREMERLDAAAAADALSRQPAALVVPAIERMLPEAAARLLLKLPPDRADRLVRELQPADAVRILSRLAPDQQAVRLDRLEPAIRDELSALASYPANSAGRLMTTRIATFRVDNTVSHLLERLGDRGMLTARSFFLVDEANRLTGKVALKDVALAAPQTLLGEMQRPITAMVHPMDPLEKVTEAFDTHRVLDLPVIDINGKFLGAITYDDIAQTIRADASVDIQTMVGVSKEERALSSPWFAVRRRMPWLQINLLTAFLAASVVGLFEATIAQVTALAVLLPVVAGQSGNTGAQALAVTMRGLALREITVRQWLRVMRKEVVAGLLNGVGVAITCGIGVFLWSGSLGLVAVISMSMVLAMIAAGFAGAVIPIALTRLGQDPATSSSIILTTVTDVAGFFSFLGIATLLMHLI